MVPHRLTLLVILLAGYATNSPKFQPSGVDWFVAVDAVFTVEVGVGLGIRFPALAPFGVGLADFES